MTNKLSNYKNKGLASLSGKKKVLALADTCKYRFY